MTGPPDSLFRFVMRYHGHADAMSRTPARDGFALWQDLWATSKQPERTGAALFVQPFAVEYPLKATTAADRVHEDVAGERAVVRLDVAGGAPGMPYARNHTTVAFIRALPEGEGAGPLVVEERKHRGIRAPENAPLAWRYYTWRHDSTTIDVLAVRSAAVYRQPDLRAGEQPVVRTPSGPLLLDFAADDDYGFARLRYDGIDGFRRAGTHRVSFDADGLPSGVYFVRLTGGSLAATKQITLLR